MSTGNMAITSSQSAEHVCMCVREDQIMLSSNSSRFESIFSIKRTGLRAEMPKHCWKMQNNSIKCQKTVIKLHCWWTLKLQCKTGRSGVKNSSHWEKIRFDRKQEVKMDVLVKSSMKVINSLQSVFVSVRGMVICQSNKPWTLKSTECKELK